MDKLLQQQTISDITRSAIGRVTTAGNHGWANKNIVLFKNIGGMTEIEGTKAVSYKHLPLQKI